MSPRDSFEKVPSELVARAVAQAADIALIMDEAGVIQDIAVSSDELAKEGYDAWVGRTFMDTVRRDSHDKVRRLLEDADGDSFHWRQVNHPSASGVDVPIRYFTLRLSSEDGRVLAVGRELRAIAELQQSLIELEQSLEQDFERARQAETRYRLLFEIAREPVLIVEAATLKIAEANPAARAILKERPQNLSGKPVLDVFETSSAEAIREMLDGVRGSGRPGEATARLARSGMDCGISSTLFRQARSVHFLLRLTVGAGREDSVVAEPEQAAVLSVAEQLPDGLVVTDKDLRVQIANSAFLELAQINTEDDARGEALDEWVGRTGVDLSVLVANVREHGAVRNFMTIVRGQLGGRETVEVSAVAVENGSEPLLGFSFRRVSERRSGAAQAKTALPQAVEQLTNMVGSVALKDIVRDTTDLIERLCIEAALELTGDNRASAAEMLGLSRQSLYSKLNRFGLAGRSDAD